MGACRKFTNRKKIYLLFITGIFVCSPICLIRQKVVRVKQNVQINHNMLTRKPIGYKGHIQPAKMLKFIDLWDSDLWATTSGAQFSKAFLKASPCTLLGFWKACESKHRTVLKIQLSNLVPKWGLNCWKSPFKAKILASALLLSHSGHQMQEKNETLRAKDLIQDHQ